MGNPFSLSINFSITVPILHFAFVHIVEQQSTKKKECAFNEATCSNGDCIAKSKVCDSNYDCTDGSDELRCSKCLALQSTSFT